MSKHTELQIRNSQPPSYTRIKDLSAGDFFILENTLYLIVKSLRTTNYLATLVVDFDSSQLRLLSNDQVVTPVSRVTMDVHF